MGRGSGSGVRVTSKGQLGQRKKEKGDRDGSKLEEGRGGQS